MTQLLANSLVFASIILLVALGFSQLYQLARFLNFAHGGVFAYAAYFHLFCVQTLLLPVWISLSFAICCAALLAGIIDQAVYRPLRRRRATSLAILLASLGVYVVIESSIALFFGSELRIVPGFLTPEIITVLGARITTVQLATIVAGSVAVVSYALILKNTPFGCMVRAVACDSFMSRAKGLHPERLILAATLLGAALAAMSGILYSMDTGLRPGMGLRPLLLAVLAALLSDANSLRGVVASAIAIGLALNLGAWFLGTQWADTVVFVSLLGFLLVRSRSIAPN